MDSTGNGAPTPNRALPKELSSRLYLAPQLRRPTALNTSSNTSSNASSTTNSPLTPNFPRTSAPRPPSPSQVHLQPLGSHANAGQIANPSPLASHSHTQSLTANHNLVPLASPGLQPTKREISAVATKKVPPIARKMKVTSFMQPGQTPSPNAAAANGSGSGSVAFANDVKSRAYAADLQSDHLIITDSQLHSHNTHGLGSSQIEQDNEHPRTRQPNERPFTNEGPRAPNDQSPNGKNPRKRPQSAQKGQNSRNGPSQDEKKAIDPFDFLASVRKMKDSVDFVYMVAQDSETLSINPYNLKIVPHAEINKANFYTASAAGITHFVDGLADFTPLDHWEREYILFRKILQIPFFKKFRLWRCYVAWKKYVRSRKIQSCRKYLQENLFLLDGDLSSSLLFVRSTCMKLVTLRLHNINRKEPYTLEDMDGNQKTHKDVIIRQLTDSVETLLDNAKQSCERVLERAGFSLERASPEKQDHLWGNNGPQSPVRGNMSNMMPNFYETPSTPQGNQSSHMNQSLSPNTKSNTVAALPAQGNSAKLTYTQMAAKRTECRRLTNYVRLIDYIVIDVLHNLAVSSVQDLLRYVSEIPQQEVDEDPSTIPVRYGSVAEAAAIAKTSLTSDPFRAGNKFSPLFRLQVLLADDYLQFSPKEDDFHRLVDTIISEFVSSVTSIPRLLSKEDLKVYLQFNMNDRMDTGLGFNGPNLHEIIWKDDFYHKLISEIKVALGHAFTRATRYTDNFEPFREIYLINKALDINALRSDAENGRRNLDAFRKDLEMYYEQRERIAELVLLRDVGIIRVESKLLKETFTPSPENCIKSIHGLLPILAAAKCKSLLDDVHDANDRLSSRPQNVENFVDFLGFLELISEKQTEINQRFEDVRAHYTLMEEHHVLVPAEDKASYQMLKPQLNKLKNSISSCEGSMVENINRFSEELDSKIADLKTNVLEIRQNALDPMISDPNATPSSVIEYLNKVSEQLTAENERSTRFTEYQKVLKVPVTRYEELEETTQDLDLKMKLWTAISEWQEKRNVWNDSAFDAIDPEEMSTQVHQYAKIAFQAEKGLPDNPVGSKFKHMVDEFKSTLPVIVNLRNPAMKDRHYARIEDAIQHKIFKTNFTVGQLVDMRVTDYKEMIEVVSNEATNEAVLEEALAKIENLWNQTEFVLLPYKDYKDVYILGSVDEIIQQAEESQVQVSTIMGSRFVGAIRKDVEKMEASLDLFGDTLEEWLTCQRSWMYLESIFSAPDIQRQLPQETKMFMGVDRFWKDTLKKTSEYPNALKSATAQGLLENFQKNNEILDKVQKNLEDYLETKRNAFPRFYFLSNDELLEILAQTKNPHAVQPHLRKCFDNLQALDFGPDPKSVDIFAMLSAEGERVPLGRNLKARGNVEAWLSSVESQMAASLKKAMKAAMLDYEKTPYSEWVIFHPAQIVLAVAQVYWGRDVEQCLQQADTIQALKDFKVKCIEQLSQLAALVRTDLTPLQRSSIVALITISVHARDIIDKLITEECRDVNDFSWLQQLRYVWDYEQDDITVKQSNATLQYCYEYLGATPRLVITPLTDRCYMTLSGAIHLNLGGAPAGPAGTGKTETVKDLAKALARQCVVFNCGEGLDYKFMGKFFSGLAQSGAWACFDEFNRIDIEVLSVIAQQLMTIQNALKTKVSKFVFEGREMKITRTCGVFITMNPGYAGRTELPDNLKALFRPVSMMIPDYALIAEIMLFSEGFENSRSLSQKMVKLYMLCSQQLSQQDHYDFGMRAVKAVLVMAGGLKRSNPSLNEDIVLIRAMRDSNIPKFLADDIGLFQAIVSDLFPGVEIPDHDYGELQIAIKDNIMEQGLQPLQNYITKVIQLHETMNVRFGVMLVGPTGGGKTTCYRVLKNAYTVLRANGSTNEKFQTVKTFVMNPKCINMGELYGEYNINTHEWTDGLAATIVRQCVGNTSIDYKWVVFDGPVDALWIENMNTVLDDNKTLCLANGERIKLNDTMRMVFEVEDLAAASPATVSRCGMVYMPAEVLGWRPYVVSWLARVMPSQLSQDLRNRIIDLFDEHVTAGLQFIRRECKEDVPSNDLNLVVSLCSLFQSLFLYDPGVDLNGTDEVIGDIAESLFFFSYIWSIGGNLVFDSRLVFDTFARAKMQQGNFPIQETVYDYYVDPRTGSFYSWRDIIPAFVYNPDTPFFNMIVPTSDTVCYSFLLQRLLRVEKSVLFVGTTGVGKSAIVSDCLKKLAEKDIVTIDLQFSAQTTSANAQSLIENKLEKKRKNIFGAPQGKKVVVFVDDCNMPAREVYGAQPPIELLRQFQDFRGFYDRKKLTWKEIRDVTIVAACAPPGGGRNVVTARFFRHFNMLSVPAPNEEVMKLIYTSIFEGFLDAFPEAVKILAKSVVEISVEVYLRIARDLLPTPAKSHYTFNLRDLAKVFQGMMMIERGSMTDKRELLRLWCHENMRVFHDRLIDEQDKLYFTTMLIELINKKFTASWDHDDVFVKNSIFFGDYMKGLASMVTNRTYEEIADYQKLIKVLETYLEDYNMNTSKQMRLVFFKDAVEHLSRIARIIRQPRGNAMLVGVGGSGRQSLTKLACFIADYKCFQVEIKKGYGYMDFREDLKKLCFTAGIAGNPVVFLLSDTQITKESFLEDVNNILNTGEVPNLFASDEREKIISDLRPHVRSLDLPETREFVYSYFIQRVRENLHIVLCMSPVGDSFRSRCRQFPSLINCSTIDWFGPWPADALLSVSRRFLDPIDLQTPEIKKAVMEMCVELHSDVKKMADQFYSELRRRFYITPKSYLEAINMFVSMLEEKKQELHVNRQRYVIGLSKLQETNEMVISMEKDLNELQPILKQKAIDTDNLMQQVMKDQEKADQAKRQVQSEEILVKKNAEETQEMAADAKRDLDEALPALEASIEALNSLNKNDITEIKSFAKPPPLVLLVMEAVCTLLQAKPDWDSAKKILGDTQFLSRLIKYDKDNIPDAVLKKLKRYIDDPTFQPANVAKQSMAARSLCMWVRAMDTYSKVAKTVAPKRERLAIAEAQLKEAEDKLREKQEMLRGIEAELALLRNKYEKSVNEKVTLQQKSEETAKRLQRASKLTSALASESVRWKETEASLAAKQELLIGSIFLASAYIAYCGPFTGPYRAKLVTGWIERFKQRSIPIGSDFTVQDTLTNPVRIREWAMWGLPIDPVSIDNAIFVTTGKRWPLMIDPQGQANRWIKNSERSRGLKVVKLTDQNLVRTLEGCVRMGAPLLIQDIGEEIDPVLDPVLEKQVTKQSGRLMIRIGDNDIDYDPNFRLYLTTKLPNPHYLPEVCIKVTIINFTVTLEGLNDQLLVDVVGIERPDLEEKREKLVVSLANDNRQLSDLEERILQLLSESKGNILDDEVLINTLNESKSTSTAIHQRVAEAEETQKDISAARNAYIPVAVRGGLLYSVIVDLGLIDPMYQFSLEYFKRLFNSCIRNTQPNANLDEHIQDLLSNSTEQVYLNVSRGLFVEHKMIFSFLISSVILRNTKQISDIEWIMLLRDPAEAPSVSTANPAPSWINHTMWHRCLLLESKLPAFAGFTASIASQVKNWQTFYDAAETHNEPLPGKWAESLSEFQRLLVIKAFREEKIVFAVTTFIMKTLGKTYTEAKPYNLETVFTSSAKDTPIIFILSTGADPTSSIFRFAEDRNYSSRLQSISLGQGQGPIAARMIQEACSSGDWVVLQNCHLAASWMPALERIVEEFNGPKAAQINESFRLWLTSMPTKAFPVSVLQNGIKLTNEPPKGLKANLFRSYADMPESYFEECTKPEPWKKLLYGLSFFHAVIQERRRFGPLGWNIRYEFNDSDLGVSRSVLKMFLEEQDEVPWKALRYVTGEINYGGRVTDDWDRRCLMSILYRYYTTEILEERYNISPSGTYHTPPIGSIESYKTFIDKLPFTEDPEVFGLHENANIAYQLQETRKIVGIINELQPRSSGSSQGMTSEQLVDKLATEILDELPKSLKLSDACDDIMTKNAHGQYNSLTTVVLHETARFNKLLGVMRRSLIDIQKAIKGLVVMSSELERMFNSMTINQVPEMWAKAAYPSLKPLASWMTDLKARVEFIQKWLIKGHPKSFWVPGLFFPQGFMTGVLQNHARKYQVAIDTISFVYTVLDTDDPNSIDRRPEDGVYVHGLFIEGARWDRRTKMLADELPMEMQSPLPIIHFTPQEHVVRNAKDYECPLYKTSTRAGVLSTTGQSTNYVIAINLKTDRNPNDWVLRGTAALCQLND